MCICIYEPKKKKVPKHSENERKKTLEGAREPRWKNEVLMQELNHHF